MKYERISFEDDKGTTNFAWLENPKEVKRFGKKFLKGKEVNAEGVSPKRSKAKHIDANDIIRRVEATMNLNKGKLEIKWN